MTSVLIVGDPIDGITLYGPFSNGERAVEYAEQRFRSETWWATELHRSEGGVGEGPEYYEGMIKGQGDTATCGCGYPITEYGGRWLHVFNDDLTGTGDHDAEPDGIRS